VPGVVEPARVEAHFNLGVLFKDHVAARATDPAAAKAAFKKAGARTHRRRSSGRTTAIKQPPCAN